jgi:hypothetical protein
MDKYPIQRIAYNKRFSNARCLRKVEIMHGIMQLHAIHYRSLCMQRFGQIRSSTLSTRHSLNDTSDSHCIILFLI